MIEPHPYEGPERRVHKLYLTRHNEYHVRKGVCVAVKPPHCAEWRTDHGAISKSLAGIVEPGMKMPTPGPPAVGVRLCFSDRLDYIITSPVVAILRPTKSVVAQYPRSD